jgi:hypothetical protein
MGFAQDIRKLIKENQWVMKALEPHDQPEYIEFDPDQCLLDFPVAGFIDTPLLPHLAEIEARIVNAYVDAHRLSSAVRNRKRGISISNTQYYEGAEDAYYEIAHLMGIDLDFLSAEVLDA